MALMGTDLRSEDFEGGASEDGEIFRGLIRFMSAQFGLIRLKRGDFFVYLTVLSCR
jgi:hypothetical protein